MPSESLGRIVLPDVANAHRPVCQNILDVHARQGRWQRHTHLTLRYVRPLSSLHDTCYHSYRIPFWSFRFLMSSFLFLLTPPPLSFFFFFLNNPAPPEISPFPLPDALPISGPVGATRPADGRVSNGAAHGDAHEAARLRLAASARLTTAA